MSSKFSITEHKKSQYKISEEVALKSVIKLCEKFDIDVDAEEDKRQKKRTESLLNGIVEYVRRGLLEITDDGKIKQHLQDAPGEVLEIDYKVITGKEKLEMDGKEENDFYAKMYAVLGAASGMGENAISKLSKIDLKVAESLTIFFL